MTITQEELKKLLHYNPETGIFTRLECRNQYSKIGMKAGWKQKVNCGKHYRMICIDNKAHLEHRLAWLYITGKFPKDEIDHINGDGCDNRLINLREVSRLINRRNIKKQHNNTSGVTGVSMHKQTGLWRSRISLNKKEIYIGLFASFDDAVIARKNAEIKYGFHKNHGSDRPL